MNSELEFRIFLKIFKGEINLSLVLNDVAKFMTSKIEVSEINETNYISTENMISNKGGITIASSLPDTKSVRKYLPKDILINNIRPYFKKIWYSDMEGGCSNDVFVIRSKENYDSKFLYYVLSSDDFFSYVMANAKGTKMPRGDKKAIQNYEVPNFSIDEQKRISFVLGEIDKKIEINKKININLEGLAKAIYRYHFIDFKPYLLGGYVEESSLGLIPKDWSVQSIEEFVDDMKNGGTPKRGESDYWDNGTVPWLKTGEINNNIIIKSEEHITELGLKNSSAKLLPINSIIMALYGKGTAARIGLLKLEATTNQACCAMICNDFNKTLFLYLFLLFNQKEIENLASGSVQQNLSKDLIANLELVVPPIEIIENLPFKEIYDKIANNYFEIEYLTNLRDTLLPKLMSGEIDVSKINCDLENSTGRG
ncbi:restriction endonuclease subunit S [Methanobrevibacter sp.]|uniref:restriction endonuclease subunit S n=1 Tax=Methanobrevibacter sp. TaxID=66852 RepID=UPI00386607A5